MVSMREIKVSEAAKILGCSALTIQCGVRCGALPIGSAWKNDGSTCWTYLISPQKLGEYIGLSREDILEKVKAMREEK